jgi:hypothetical protein
MKAQERSVTVEITVTDVIGNKAKKQIFISVDEYRNNPGNKSMPAIISERIFEKLNQLNNEFYPFLEKPEV